jgi:NAD(P)-dependent dehydrogenase (short-subunit alcohol dehydrogenase family)
MADRIVSPFGPATTAAEVVAGHDLAGRRAIVTGGSGTVGIETARALAAAGAQVVLAVRNLAAGQAAAADINRGLDQPKATAASLDLADLRSVRAFTQAWGDGPLHMLVNNAAVLALPLGYTAQGFETHIGVNHFGHAALTLGLLQALRRAAAPGRHARVVQVSSACHQDSGVHFDDLHYRTRPYDKLDAYGQAKTANVLFALALNTRFGSAGVNANAVMPGGIASGLQKHLVAGDMDRWTDPSKARGPIAKTPAQGAATSVWAAVGAELEGVGGLYLEDCAQAPFMDETSYYTDVAPYALDPAAADRLWALTLEALQAAEVAVA